MSLGLWLLLLAAVAGAGGLVYLGSRPTPTPVRPEPVTVVVVADTQDLGTRRRGDVVTATFVIRNTHPVAVECGPIMKGCSCSAATIEPNVIPSGGESKLTVVWNLAGKRGPSAEALWIPFAGAGDVKGSVTARVVATVRGVVEPDREVIDLSETTRTGEVAFHSPIGRAFRCVGAGSNHPCVTATVAPTGDRIQFTFDPAVKGWEYGNIYVNVVTDQPDDQEVRLIVRLNKKLQPQAGDSP